MAFTHDTLERKPYQIMDEFHHATRSNDERIATSTTLATLLVDPTGNA